MTFRAGTERRPETSHRNFCEIAMPTLDLDKTPRKREIMANRVVAIADQLSQGANRPSTDVGTFVGKIPG